MYAGLRERFLALLVDVLFFCACFFPITRLVKGVWLMSPNDHNWVRGWFIFEPLCLAFLGMIGLSFIVLEGWLGATLGKSIMGLRVIGLDGGRAACGKAQCGMPCAWSTGCRRSTCSGSSSSSVPRNRTRLGDRIAGTRVILRIASQSS